MRISLRTKLTLSLIGMSLLAIFAMGLAARGLMLRRFDSFVVARAITGFEHEVKLYYRAYGSWERARQTETFFQFVERVQARPLGEGGAPTMLAPPFEQPAQRPRPPANRPGEPTLTPDGRPPRRFEMGGPAPPFIVTDVEGRVLLPLDGKKLGDMMPAELVARGRPLDVDGEIVGLAVPQNRPTLSLMEEQYLASMNDAWVLSLLVALGLAVPFGLLLSARLTRPIRELNQAMGAMENGSLRQTVPSRSRDELGQLAERFNRMSAKLADTYDELELSRASLAELSLRDELTGLYNRRAFDELSAALLVQARRYDHQTSVAMLDIDRFKQINDQCGHAAGDQVLIHAAAILSSILRDTDVVARWGGEEFVILFPETNGGGAAVLAERIRERFERTDWSVILECQVTVSIGVAELAAGEALCDALGRADGQLYAAKKAGRNRIHH